MKPKKIPMRTCVVTHEKYPKKELIRVVRTPEGNVVVDVTGKQNGIYISSTGTLNLGDNSTGVQSLPKIVSTATTGTYYGVYKYNSGGTFNFYDGTIISNFSPDNSFIILDILEPLSPIQHPIGSILAYSE